MEEASSLWHNQQQTVGRRAANRTPLALTRSRGYIVSTSGYAIVHYDRDSSNDACLLDREPSGPIQEICASEHLKEVTQHTVSYGNHASTLDRPVRGTHRANYISIAGVEQECRTIIFVGSWLMRPSTGWTIYVVSHYGYGS